MPCDKKRHVKPHGLSKEERIRKAEDFKRVRRGGKRLTCENFVVFLLQNEFGYARLGISVRKALGSAVARNRAKRLIREFFRQNKAKLPAGYDFLILPKRDVSHLSYKDVERELGELIIGRPFKA